MKLNIENFKPSDTSPWKCYDVLTIHIKLIVYRNLSLIYIWKHYNIRFIVYDTFYIPRGSSYSISHVG